ncbi:protein kinase [Nocardia sp. NPDC059240]|uniref:serine/threonine-protein kinase n=1 Tax=Nocardia sp. NPDC059240 TaxID=3346786 RepID=UPI003688E5C5
MRLEPGAEFAGFTIERVLGNGGMGVVYLARNPRLNRLVALKVLGDLIAADPRGRARFEREAALAARLEHPNIVAIYDRADSEAESPWISMKFVSGGDVAQRMAERGGPLAPDEAVRILTDAAHGLDYAHQHGVLHRDVKPGNILLDRSTPHRDRALLTDFGIARALDDTLTLTGTAATFAYAAPERFHGTTADHRADIYSLGCTLYELLTATQPFPRTDQAAVLAAHLTAPPPRPTDTNPALPPGLNDVIAIAMAKNPDDRYPTCTALADAATRVLADAGRAHADRGNPRTAPTLAAPPRQEFIETLPAADSPNTAPDADLPDSIRTALDSPHPEIRQGAVHALGTILSSSDKVRADSARNALRDIAISDVPAVASAAREVLGGASTMDSPRLPTVRQPRDKSSPSPGPAGPPDHAPQGGSWASATGPRGPEASTPGRTPDPSAGTVGADSSGTSGTQPDTSKRVDVGAAGRGRRRGKLATVVTGLSGVSAFVAGGVMLDSGHMPFADSTSSGLTFLPFGDLVSGGDLYLAVLTFVSAAVGLLTFLVQPRRQITQALLAGFAATSLWGVAVIARLEGWITRERPMFDVSTGAHFALNGHLFLCLATVLAVAALLLEGTRFEFHWPRGRFATATAVLAGVGCASLTAVLLRSVIGSPITRVDFYWQFATAAMLALAPVLLSAVHPRWPAGLLTIGYVAGESVIGTLLIAQARSQSRTTAELWSVAMPVLSMITLVAIAAVSVLELRRTSRQ